MFKNLGNLVAAEPAFTLGVVNAGAALAVGFGLHISTHQVGLLNAFVAAVLSLVTRAKVSPVPPSA